MATPFLELPHGIPDSNTFRRVFGRIAPEALSKYLYDWLGCHWEKSTVVAIDGKTIWGIKSKIYKAYHVVSAFAAENQMAIGELVTEEKPNEVTAVPDLLDALNVAGSIVTADAMSCPACYNGDTPKTEEDDRPMQRPIPKLQWEGTGLTMPCLSCHARFGKLSAGPPIAAFDLRRLKNGNAPYIRVTKQAEWWWAAADAG